MGNTLISGAADKKALGQKATQILDVFPDGLTMTIHNIIAEGDSVAVEAESMGTNTAGQIYNNKYHFLFRFKGDKVLEVKEYLDTEHVTEVLRGGQRPANANAA